MWTFGKAFHELPYKSWFMGMYGAGSAILCQTMPVVLFGTPGNFQCVPIILSILYGKRKAGLFAVGSLSVYQLFVTPYYLPSILAILVYSAIPFFLCRRFDTFTRRERFTASTLLTFATLVVEILFLSVYYSIMFGVEGIGMLFSEHWGYLLSASVAQSAMMIAVFFLLEKNIEDGHVRKRLESLVRYNPLGISAFDMNDRFVSVNSAYEKITGYSESELVGRSRYTLWAEEDYSTARAVLDYSLQGEIKKDVEVELRHKRGHKIPIRFTLVPMKDGDRMVGYFAMVTDLTETKLAERVLQTQEKMSVIGQMAAGVAHEIRNPLTSIKGFLHILSGSLTPGQTKYYDIMKGELNRIESIVSEMLVLAKPQTATFHAMDVREKITEAVTQLANEARISNVQLTVELSDSIPQLIGDGNQLKQVFLNLATNALEAMPDGGRLKIAVRSDERRRVVVTFEDTGPGIPDSILSKIGEPFYSTKTKGTGLGFMVSKRIIDNHNGAIRIRTSETDGTTVTVELPAPGSPDSV
jgi:PAS domain S-box-containing protein